LVNSLKSGQASSAGEFTAALRAARLSEAAHLEAIFDIRDAKTLRLQVLKDDLSHLLGSHPSAHHFDLALVAGEPPRLWIDLVTSVVMEPDPRTFRLVSDTEAGPETLFQTSDRAAMVARIKAEMAHRVVAKARSLRPAPAAHEVRKGASLIFAWLVGAATGVLLTLVGLFLWRLALT
jgi:hypothetical protein